MAVKLKRLVSEAGAGEDKSFGVSDANPDMFTLLKALADTQNALVAQFNQLLSDYNGETVAAHTTSASTVVAAGVTVEA